MIGTCIAEYLALHKSTVAESVVLAAVESRAAHTKRVARATGLVVGSILKATIWVVATGRNVGEGVEEEEEDEEDRRKAMI